MGSIDAMAIHFHFHCVAILLGANVLLFLGAS